MAEVRVVYRKFDGSLHWNHAARRLGEDEHGVWLGVPVDTQIFKGEPESEPLRAPFVLLMPRGAWWTASYNAEPHRTEIYCDVTTEPRWLTPHEVTMVDLDLDVRRRRAGAVELLDEDEFAVHRVQFGYPPDVVDAAVSAADWLYSAVCDRVEPFDVAYKSWLAQVI